MLKNPRKTNLPPDAIILFMDGDKLCAVHRDFDNPQESPQGFGEDILAALHSLRQDLVDEGEGIRKRIGYTDVLINSVYRSQGCSEMDITCKQASRTVATWPEWKQNILVQSGKATHDTPRSAVSNDDGGF
jgi:hypothetical protein